MRLILAAALIAATTSNAEALRTPDPGKADPRMTTAPYSQDEVYSLVIEAGQTATVRLADDDTRLEMWGADKTLMRSAISGSTVLLWTTDPVAPRSIVINAIRPDGKTRTYTLMVEARRFDEPKIDGGQRAVPIVSLRFTFPDDEKARLAAQWRAGAAKRAEADVLKTFAAQDGANDTNKAYKLQGGKSEDWDLLPTRRVSDDGTNTHFWFPGNMRVPLIYAVTPDGKEAVVDPTFNSQTGVATVHQLGRQWRLRGEGDAILCVFNTRYDPIGVRPETGTASPMVQRVTR